MIFVANHIGLYFHHFMQIRLARWPVRLAVFLAISGLVVAEETSNQLTSKEKTEGWKLLFDGKTTHGWRSFQKDKFPAEGWTVEDGWLHCLGTTGGDIITDAEFGD